MINRNFKTNWLEILNYNAKMVILDKPSIGKELVRIPLTPIKVNSYILYYLSESLYPKFINDQQNILDILISNENNDVLGLYLYETNKAGIHESIETLPNDIFVIQKEDLVNIEDLFNKVQMVIIKRTGIRISSIRIFKKKALDLINIQNKNIESESIYNNFVSLINLIQKYYEEDLFFIYPIPNFFIFTKESIKLLNGIKLSHIFRFLYEIIPSIKVCIILYSQKQPIILKLQNLKHKLDFSDLFIELMIPEELEIDIKNLNNQEILRIIKEKLECEKTYLFNQHDIISFLLNIFESEFPLSSSKLKIILQKLLFGLRNFQNKWDMIPRPKVYNSLFRFFTRLFRFNLNLKKISHWAIPELIFNIIETRLGLTSKILIIMTSKNNKINNKVEYIKNNFCFALIVEIEDRKIVKVVPLHKKELFSESKINSLDVIKENISDKYGYVSAALNIDQYLISELFSNFNSKIANFTPFSKLKTLKLFEEEYYFNIFPEFPEFKLFKNMGSSKFFKSILPILIDKHEF